MTKASVVGRKGPLAVLIGERMFVTMILLQLACFVKSRADRTKRIVVL
jgi:hypothetical protein